MLKTIRRSMCTAICTTALAMSATAYASPATDQQTTDTTTTTTQQQVAVDPDTGAQRSAVPVEGVGLRLNTQPGDQVSIVGGVVTWLDDAGEVVATITLSSEQGGGLDFTYNTATHIISPKATRTLNSASTLAATRCMPKWWGWFYNIAWGTLVCLPASAGATGLATPLAGYATAIACEAAGGALVTAVSC